jgi:hypothetical protein
VTAMVMAENSAKQIEGGIVMSNGEMRIVDGLKIEVVPACSVAHMQSPRVPFLPQNVGSGYVSSDMKIVKTIGTAMLPMNRPCTMTSEAATMTPQR